MLRVLIKKVKKLGSKTTMSDGFNPSKKPQDSKKDKLNIKEKRKRINKN